MARDWSKRDHLSHMGQKSLKVDQRVGAPWWAIRDGSLLVGWSAVSTSDRGVASSGDSCWMVVATGGGHS